jgi:hypothetical protein
MTAAASVASIAQPVSTSPNSSQVSALNLASRIWRIGL